MYISETSKTMWFAIFLLVIKNIGGILIMARTFTCNEEIIVISKGTEDIGKLAMLGNGGKFDPSVIPTIERKNTICLVSRNAAQSIPNSTATAIIFDTVLLDSDDMHDAVSPSRIVIPSDGIYQIVSQVIFNYQGTGVRSAGITVNGSTNLSGQTSTANGVNTWELNSGSIHMFKKGDYIELIAYQASGGALNVITDSSNGSPSLSIYKISD
jgi:hypothetical protein